MRQSREIVRPFAYGGLIAVVFALDAVTPPGMNVPILYLLPLLLAFLIEDVPARVALTAIVTVLTAASLAWKWSDAWFPGAVNRAFDFGVFWVALALSVRDARTTGELRDLHRALDNASIVAIADARGTIRHVNDRFCEISRYARDELIGRDLCFLEAGTPPETGTNDFWNTLAAGRIWHGEVHNRARDGSLYWVDTTVVPFMGRRAEPRQFLAIHNDITARKRAEARLRNQAALAKLEQMAAIVAHEVRNPLAGVRAGLQMFEHRPSLPPAERLVVRQMVERLDLLSAHVTGLLQLARLRSPQLEQVDVRPLLDEAARLVLQTAACADIDCQIAGPDGRVLGDVVMLREVFTHLLLNAAQALPGGGRIAVTLAGTDDALDVLVADSGNGIPPALHQRVFEPFYTTKPDGAGLGLAVVKQLVELHGGEIGVVSSSSSGTTIGVHLPRAVDPAPGAVRGSL
jgi:PAS domain S-box-containing protein